MTDVNDESVVACAVCSTDIAPDDAYTTESQDIVCSDCMVSCNRCGDIGTDQEDWFVVDYNTWCEGCTERYASYCESCEEYTESSTNYVADRDANWCDECVTGCYWCDDCSQYYYEGYCEDCQDSRVVHDYSYRPDPIFHSTDGRERLYFGLEIEVEAGHNYGEASEYASQLESLDLAYLKSDGSLNCGFEVVTHPMSHGFLKNEAQEFFDVITGLRNEHKVKSWGTSTCGLHIHISRTGFNGGAHMHRFLNLVYSNQDFYEAMAGRSSDRWAKFDDITLTEWVYDDYGNRVDRKVTRSFARKLDSNRGSDRYSAVNTNNASTLEMRIFKGTTNARTIMSHIDLAHASVEYTRSLSLQEVKNGALLPEQFIAYIVANEKLYPELVERIDRLYIPTVWLTRQNVSA